MKVERSCGVPGGKPPPRAPRQQVQLKGHKGHKGPVLPIKLCGMRSRQLRSRQLFCLSRSLWRRASALSPVTFRLEDDHTALRHHIPSVAKTAARRTRTRMTRRTRRTRTAARPATTKTAVGGRTGISPLSSWTIESSLVTVSRKPVTPVCGACAPKTPPRCLSTMPPAPGHNRGGRGAPGYSGEARGLAAATLWLTATRVVAAARQAAVGALSPSGAPHSSTSAPRCTRAAST